jgi:hypothetical protein
MFLFLVFGHKRCKELDNRDTLYQLNSEIMSCDDGNSLARSLDDRTPLQYHQVLDCSSRQEEQNHGRCKYGSGFADRRQAEFVSVCRCLAFTLGVKCSLREDVGPTFIDNNDVTDEVGRTAVPTRFWRCCFLTEYRSTGFLQMNRLIGS